MTQEYFANQIPDDLAKDLMGKIDHYYNWLMVSGRLGRYRIAFDSYYGQRDQHRSSHVTAAGEKGELSFLMANEYRNLVQHLLVLATQNRPSIECAAVNTDRKSQEQAILGKQLLDYYRKEGGLDRYAKYALEISMIMDLSWVFTEWDVTKGDPLRPDMQGQIITDGDVSSRVKTPLDVIFDYTQDNGVEIEWQMVRDLVNKYDLAAQYPEKKDEILSVSRDRTRDSMYRFGDQALYGFNYLESPLIERFTFFHKKTPGCKNGRMFQFLNGKCWLFDGPTPYRRLPGRRCCPTEMISSSMGYSNTNDLLGMQDVMDALVSSAVTNMTSAGINNIWCKPDSNIDFEQLSSGMNFIESDERPEVLMLNKLSPEWFNLANWIVSRMEAYSGVNSVARGNTEGKDFSGAAMALLQSMAIQFNSGVQSSYTQLIEDINNDALYLLQDFAKNPKLALIAGENQRYMLESFTGANLDKIQRVYVRQSNSMQDTTAGKMVIADKMMAIPNAITTPEQYLEVVQTGQLQPLLENKNKELLCIRDENEKLSKGDYISVVVTENHPRHIMGHGVNIADPESKKNLQLVQSTLAHIQEHINQWKMADPVLLQALNIPPIPPQLIAMGNPMGGPQNPNSGAAMSPMGEPPQSPASAGGPLPEPASQPNLPTNPLTGEQAPQPTNGGMNV
jgi:hypothetical protein